MGKRGTLASHDCSGMNPLFQLGVSIVFSFVFASKQEARFCISFRTPSWLVTLFECYEEEETAFRAKLFALILELLGRMNAPWISADDWLWLKFLLPFSIQRTTFLWIVSSRAL